MFLIYIGLVSYTEDRVWVYKLLFSIEKSVPTWGCVPLMACLSPSLEYHRGNAISAAISGLSFCSSWPSKWPNLLKLGCRCQPQDIYSLVIETPTSVINPIRDHSKLLPEDRTSHWQEQTPLQTANIIIIIIIRGWVPACACQSQNKHWTPLENKSQGWLST